MLYIEFKIKDLLKYTDFQKLFDHMVKTRQPGFELQYKVIPEEHEEPEYDWENMTDDEWQEIKDRWAEERAKAKPAITPEMERYQQLIPDYANSFLESYVGFDKERAGVFGFNTLGIFNYLEVTFEVDMDNLEKLNEGTGIVEFSTGNFPFGGMERFLMTLKAFDLIPTECFNGFTIYEFDWTSDYAHDAIELPKKTKEYLAKFKR